MNLEELMVELIKEEINNAIMDTIVFANRTDMNTIRECILDIIQDGVMLKNVGAKRIFRILLKKSRELGLDISDSNIQNKIYYKLDNNEITFKIQFVDSGKTEELRIEL